MKNKHEIKHRHIVCSCCGEMQDPVLMDAEEQAAFMVLYKAFLRGKQGKEKRLQAEKDVNSVYEGIQDRDDFIAVSNLLTNGLSEFELVAHADDIKGQAWAWSAKFLADRMKHKGTWETSLDQSARDEIEALAQQVYAPH